MNTFAWIARLIAFDTTSRNSNLPLINEIADWFARHHIDVRLTYDSTKQKANLFATLPARDGKTQGGLILSGHTDTVPVDGQIWNTDPFRAVQIDDKIYGRGACDMKGFIAVVLALLPEFRELALSQPLHFAFSYDEEVGCLGARVLIDDFLVAGIQAKACIVGEPTDMYPVVAHKGIQAFQCRVQGQSAHSSLTPQGCNAIEYAAKLITYLRDFADELAQQGPFDPHFDVPFTSLSTNMIQGGTAGNIIPAECEFNFEFRHLPNVQPHTIIDRIKNYTDTELLPQMRHQHINATIEINNKGAVPAFEATEDAGLIRIAYEIAEKSEVRKVAYATEAGLFQAASIPTIICGPGNIEQAHRPNEFVTLLQLEQCATFLRKIVQKLG